MGASRNRCRLERCRRAMDGARRRAQEGFIWADDTSIVPGPAGQRLATGMRAAVLAVARAGNDVLADDVFIDPGWLDDWRSQLDGLEWLLVGVLVSIDVLEERERARGNRILGEARHPSRSLVKSHSSP